MDAFGPTQMSVRNQERERRSVGQGGSSGAESTIRHALPRNRRDIRPKPRCSLREHVTITLLVIPASALFWHMHCAGLFV